MTGRVLIVTTPDQELHRAPKGHPETAERVEAVLRGASGVRGAELIEGRPAEPAELELVHTREHVARISALSSRGGGWIDQDTFATGGTYAAACGAAGAGLTAIERLAGDPGLEAAFVVTRPPGHHASAHSAAGFCFFNNIAIAASSLIETGARVAIMDWDAHHGNGTQDIFWSEDRLLYLSLHQESLYPGTGYPHERGPVAGPLTTVNLPLPGGATGEHYLRLLDDIAEPVVRQFAPDWILVSCGFDAHIEDPLAEMALEARDFALLTARVMSWAPGTARTAFFLEGGYDLGALQESTTAVVSTLADPRQARPAPSTGGPGADRVEELVGLWSTGRLE